MEAFWQHSRNHHQNITYNQNKTRHPSRVPCSSISMYHHQEPSISRRLLYSSFHPHINRSHHNFSGTLNGLPSSRLEFDLFRHAICNVPDRVFLPCLNIGKHHTGVLVAADANRSKKRLDLLRSDCRPVHCVKCKGV